MEQWWNDTDSQTRNLFAQNSVPVSFFPKFSTWTNL